MASKQPAVVLVQPAVVLVLMQASHQPGHEGRGDMLPAVITMPAHTQAVAS